MSTLINRKYVKQYALSVAAHRAHQFTRVGSDFFIKVDAQVRAFIADYVKHLPSKGKTIT
jgi:acyl-[acyl carrier protein]--UDP-N-acetylglucosamine O-acyltransferase